MGLVLRDYQEEAVKAITKAAVSVLKTGRRRRPLVVQPTGAGKTVMMLFAARYLFRIYGWKTLIVVPSVKLVEQTIASAAKFYPDWTSGQVGDSQFTVTPETALDVATAAGLNPDKLFDRGILPDKYQLVIIDEAHHAPASTYTRILEYFESSYLKIGFTATFKRGDSISVASKNYFPEIIAYNTIGRLTDKGYLVPAKGYLVHTGMSLDLVMSKNGDYTQKSLEKANIPERNALAVEKWLEIAPGQKTIAFTVSINHARDLAAAFRDRGIPAEAIWGNMNRNDFDEILSKFRSGEIKVLCNCNLLIEGFDEPSVSCVLITRPSTPASLCVLGPQMIGRALRLYEGKPHACIIELQDLKKNPLSSEEKPPGELRLRGAAAQTADEETGSAIAETFDIDTIDLHLGGSGFETNEYLHVKGKQKQKTQLMRERRKLIAMMTSGSEVLKEGLTEFFDVIEKVGSSSLYSWIPLGEIYYLDLSDGNFAEISKRDQAWEAQVAIGDHMETIVFTPDLKEAFELADFYISENFPVGALIDRNAPWRNSPPTDSQVRKARSLTGLEETYFRSMTKGQLSDLIGYYAAIRNLRERA
jgi:superfamily II DNA or RNA helicase